MAVRRRGKIKIVIAVATYCVACSSTAAEVKWLAQIQQPPAKLSDNSPRLGALLADKSGTPITDRAAWEPRRAEIRQWWLDFLGVWDAAPVSNDIEVVTSESLDGFTRQLIRYESEPGERVEAYLLRPARSDKPAPGVVALHSTANQTIRQPAGIEGKPQEAWGPLLAKRGFVVICPRCFLWPRGEAIDTKGTLAELSQRHPGAKGMAKMLYDARRAVDILAAQPGVDPKRLGAVGHSLGGKEVLYLAAFDERIKAAVSSEGGIGTKFSNWHDPWYLTDAIQKRDFNREHHEQLALVAPRPFLLIGGDSADGAASWPFIEAALPVFRLYGEPARIGLLNHRQGHSIPPIAVERTAQWFETYLK